MVNVGQTLNIDPSKLVRFGAAVYASAGVPEADAELLSDTLVQADLWGHQSHGVLRLGWYLDRLRNGVMQAVTRPEQVLDAGALGLVDGHEGIGQVTTMQATRQAMDRARAHGIAAVGVRNSNHFGTCMYYTGMAARAGFIMMMTTNGGPGMAPWGGRKKIIGTNPWSVSAPAGARPPFIMDMATTGVARGKIYLARNRGEKIPTGWAINAKGEPTTDPQEAIDGIILPMAEHKGYAIAVMIDMLSGVLTGSGFLSGVSSPYQTDRRSNAGHFIIAINVAAIQPLDAFCSRMEDYISQLKAVPLAAGFDEIFYPGEMEARNDERNRRSGLQLPADTIADLERVARETSLTSMLPW